MDSEAMNFNPYADYEPEGSCIYPCPEESFILMQENPWGGIDGDETWEITNDDTGEVVLSGNVESGYDCDYYCGDMECLLPGCYTITTYGDFDGYISIQEPSQNCNGCTNWLGEVYSNSSMSFCIGDDDTCEEGEESVYTYGYNVGSYTVTYADGTVLDMSYDSDWNTVYECVPEGDYTVCVDFGGSDYGYFYFGDMYFDAWNIYYNDCHK